MNIVHFFSDGFGEMNSSNWRGRIPCAALRRAGHRVVTPQIDKWFKDTPDSRELCSFSDIIILQRVLVEESIERVRFWRNRKKAVVVDVDDSYALLRPEDGNQASKFWYSGKVEVGFAGVGVKYEKVLDKHPLEQFVVGAKIASGITMPSRILMEDWQWVAPCFYVPNHIDSPRYLKAKSIPKKNDGNLIIGWGGSMSHLNSFRKSGVSEALRRVFQQRKNVKFMLCGDQRIIDLIPIPKDRLIFQPYVLWKDWPRIIRQFDIGIAPLAGRYDDSRSSIKCLEAAIMGIPTVASGSPAYKDWIENGVGVFTKDSSDDMEKMEERSAEWETKLLDVIDNYEYHNGLIDSKFDYAMTWDVDANVGNIVNTYQDIINRG